MIEKGVRAAGAEPGDLGRRRFVQTLAWSVLGFHSRKRLLGGPRDFSAEQLPVMEGSPGPMTIIDGKPYHYFGGTSYYCLHGHPELIRAGIDALQRYGLGSATSRIDTEAVKSILSSSDVPICFNGQESDDLFTFGCLIMELSSTPVLKLSPGPPCTTPFEAHRF